MDEKNTFDKQSESGTEGGQRSRTAAGREMLSQLQQMIDTVAASAGPAMRDVAAKAAELAALAGEKAGPIAHRAAGVTESVGQRVAVRSKEMAADLRRPKADTAAAEGAQEEWTGDSDADAAAGASDEGMGDQD